jgi:hypothetical protein
MDIENELLLANLEPNKSINSFSIDLYTFNEGKQPNYQNLFYYISKMVRARFASRNEYQKSQYYQYLKQDNFYENYINYTIRKEIENVMYLYNIDSDGNLVRRPETMIATEDVRDSNYDRQVRMIIHVCCGLLNKNYGSAKWLYMYQKGSRSMILPKERYNNDLAVSILKEVVKKNRDQYFTNLTLDGLRHNIMNSFLYESGREGERKEETKTETEADNEAGKCVRKNVLSLDRYPLGVVEVLMPSVDIIQSVDIQRIRDADLNKFLTDLQKKDPKMTESMEDSDFLYKDFHDLYNRKLLETNRIHGGISLCDYKSDTYSFAYSLFENKENEIPMQNIYKIALMEKKKKGFRQPFFYEDCPTTIRNIHAGKVVLLDSKTYGGYIYGKLLSEKDILETKNGNKLECVLLTLATTPTNMSDEAFIQGTFENPENVFHRSIWEQKSLTQNIPVNLNLIHRIFEILEIDKYHLIIGEKYTFVHQGVIKNLELKSVLGEGNRNEELLLTFEDNYSDEMSDATQNSVDVRTQHVKMTLRELKIKFIHAPEKVEFVYSLKLGDMILSDGLVYFYTGRLQNQNFTDYNLLCKDIEKKEVIIPYRKIHGYVLKAEDWIEHLQYSLLLDDNSNTKIYRFLPKLYQLLVTKGTVSETGENPSGFIGKDIKKGRIVNDEVMRKYLYQYGYHDTYATTQSLVFYLYHYNTYKHIEKLLKQKIEKKDRLRGDQNKISVGTVHGSNSKKSRMQENAQSLSQELLPAPKGNREQEYANQMETSDSNIHTRIRDIILSISDPIRKRRILKKYISDYCFVFKNEAVVTTESKSHKQDCGLWLMVPDSEKNVMIPVLCIHYKYLVEDDRENFENLLIKDGKGEHLFCRNCHEILEQVDFDTFEGFDNEGEDGQKNKTRESSRVLNGDREFAGYSFDAQMKEFLNQQLPTSERNKMREKTLNQVRRDMYGAFDGQYVYDVFLEEYAKLSKITPLKQDPGYLLQHKSEWDTILGLFKKMNLNLTTKKDVASIEQLREEKKMKEEKIRQFTEGVRKYKSLLKKKPKTQQDIESIMSLKESILNQVYGMFGKNPPPEAVTDDQKESQLKILGGSLRSELEQVIDEIWYKSSTNIEKVRICIRILLKYWYAQTCFHKIIYDESFIQSSEYSFPSYYNTKMNEILDIKEVPKSLLNKMTALNIVQQWYGNFKKSYDVKRSMEESESLEAKRLRMGQYNGDSQSSLTVYYPRNWASPLLYVETMDEKQEQELYFTPQIKSQYDPSKVSWQRFNELMKFKTLEYFFGDKFDEKVEIDFKEWSTIWRYNYRLFRDYTQQYFYLNVLHQPKNKIFEYDYSLLDFPFVDPQTPDIRPENDYVLETHLSPDMNILIDYYVKSLEENSKSYDELKEILIKCRVKKPFIDEWTIFYTRIFELTQSGLEYDEQSGEFTKVPKKKFSAIETAKMIISDFLGFITFANRIFFSADGMEFAEYISLQEYKEQERQEYIGQFKDCFGILENMYDFGSSNESIFQISNQQFVVWMETFLAHVRINKYENEDRLILWATRFVQQELLSYFRTGKLEQGKRYNCCKVKIFKIYFDRLLALRPVKPEESEEILLPPKQKIQLKYDPVEQILAAQKKKTAGVRLVNFWELDEYIEYMNVDRETNEHEIEQEGDELVAASETLEPERSVYNYARDGDNLNPLDQLEEIFADDYIGDENGDENGDQDYD